MPSKKICLTMGDPSGIGPQILSRSLNHFNNSQLKELIVIADPVILKKAGLTNQAAQKIDLVDLRLEDRKRFKFGSSDRNCARAAIECLKKAVMIIKENRASAVVTNPVSKASIDLILPGFKGQTDFLAVIDKAKETKMMLTAGHLRFVLVTTHVALKEVPSKLTKQGIVKTIEVACKGLKEQFLIERPSIAVTGFNPHLGEASLLGAEEERVIRPAIKMASRLRGLKISGPVSVEKAVEMSKRSKVDAVISMYHDQAIVPLKLIFPFRGVNLTLGLSFVRTSPLHGTAFDIAAENGRADCRSFLDALALAKKLVKQLPEGI